MPESKNAKVVINSLGNKVIVSKDIAPAVEVATVNGNTVPLFPTKNGYEYFVFRAAIRR